MAQSKSNGETDMQQFNKNFRLFFKKLTDLTGKSLASTEFRVLNFEIKRDLLTKATSRFEIINVPSAIEVGDVVGMYDSFGTIVFEGIVNLIEDNTVQAEQMYDIFNDTWLWNNPQQATIEETLKSILVNDFQNNRDTLMASIFSSFDITTSSSTNLTLQSEDDRYQTPFASFLYEIYEKYGIVLNINVSYSEGRCNIDIGVPNYNRLKIANNVFAFRNFDIISEVYETNKLVVYSESTGDYRGEWFTTSTGITSDPQALNRIPKMKTEIVFSDDDIDTLKASSLRNEIYNHQIEFDLVFDNKLIPFTDLRLGQGADIYFNSDYYDTILTGYEYSMSNNNDGNETIRLKFGLVRTSLTNKLFKRLK